MSSTFTHAPRPAILSKQAKNAWQRRYGPGVSTLDYKLYPRTAEERNMRCELRVFRDGNTDLAEVQISMGINTNVSIAVRLTSDELRDLAARLIDAAHDIETLPAAVLATTLEGGAA